MFNLEIFLTNSNILFNFQRNCEWENLKLNHKAIENICRYRCYVFISIRNTSVNYLITYMRQNGNYVSLKVQENCRNWKYANWVIGTFLFLTRGTDYEQICILINPLVDEVLKTMFFFFCRKWRKSCMLIHNTYV